MHFGQQSMEDIAAEKSGHFKIQALSSDFLI